MDQQPQRFFRANLSELATTSCFRLPTAILTWWLMPLDAPFGGRLNRVRPLWTARRKELYWVIIPTASRKDGISLSAYVRQK